ncbi:MAG: hypothetical protein P8Y45_17050 [Exilibacterium sp.]
MDKVWVRYFLIAKKPAYNELTVYVVLTNVDYGATVVARDFLFGGWPQGFRPLLVPRAYISAVISRAVAFPVAATLKKGTGFQALPLLRSYIVAE